jgi:hypothetical protein
MKFNIDYNKKKENRLLTYDVDELGFDIEPRSDYAMDIDLALNTLELNIANDDRSVVEVLGFCGYGNWIKSNFSVPQYKEGSLKVTDDLVAGIGSYRINKEDLPIYVNILTGWICIGNPEKSGSAVEFINNCVAVINYDGEFIALWLKPQTLPHL